MKGLFLTVKGNNQKIETNAAQGSFSSNLFELSLRAEYNFLDLDRHSITPYIGTGPGVYGLANYKSSTGTKPGKDRVGFVLPLSGGVKFKVTEQMLLSLDGGIRFFNKNLDNVVSPNNTTRYTTVGVGILFIPKKKNLLW